MSSSEHEHTDLTPGARRLGGLLRPASEEEQWGAASWSGGTSNWSRSDVVRRRGARTDSAVDPQAWAGDVLLWTTGDEPAPLLVAGESTVMIESASDVVRWEHESNALAQAWYDAHPGGSVELTAGVMWYGTRCHGLRFATVPGGPVLATVNVETTARGMGWE